MAEPTEKPPTDEQIQAYLLGRLSDEDADPIEAMTIADDDVAWRLRAAEDDLVDAYIRGDLDAETRQQFERYYMASPRRRERVALARGFNRAVERTEARPELRLVPPSGPVAVATRPRNPAAFCGRPRQRSSCWRLSPDGSAAEPPRFPGPRRRTSPRAPPRARPESGQGSCGRFRPHRRLNPGGRQRPRPPTTRRARPTRLRRSSCCRRRAR